MRSGTFRVVLGVFLLHLTQPAFAAPPDKCAATLKKATAGLTKVVRDIDKRTSREAANAGSAGQAVYKVAMALLEALAKQSRATGNEDDLTAARHLDDAVTRLKVIVPTAAAIAAWAEANETCDQVKLLGHADPNTVCEARGRLSGKVKAACRKCDAATAKMQQLARGTPAGEHTIAELIETTVEDIDYLLEGLDDPEFKSSTLAARRRASLSKPLKTLKVALKAALDSSQAGEAAWEVYDDLRGGTYSPGLVEKLERLPKGMKASGHARQLERFCRIAPRQPPHSGCEKACLEDGRCGKDIGCVARDDRDCLESVTCRESGRCRAVEGKCMRAAQDATACEDWDGCAKDGQCSVVDGVCAAATDAACKASSGCKTHARCTLEYAILGPGARCGLTSTDDCRSSDRCKVHGACTLHVGSFSGMKDCRPSGPQDCRQSAGCREFGRCSQVVYSAVNMCLVASPADCKESAACKESGMCFYKPTQEWYGKPVHGCCADKDGCCKRVDGACVK